MRSVVFLHDIVFCIFRCKPVSHTVLYAAAVADPENFGGGDFKHKTSKIRMSSPKLRAIFWPESEIQTIFSPKIRWSPKKKKVFTKIESDFSAGFVSFRLVGGMHLEMEPSYSK